MFGDQGRRDCAVAFLLLREQTTRPGPDRFLRALILLKHRYGDRHIDDANPEGADRRRARAIHRACEQGASRLPTARRPLGIRAQVDATIPAEYVLLKHYLGEGDELGIELKIAGYLRRTPARRGRMAAGLQRRFRSERQRQGVFRARR